MLNGLMQQRELVIFHFFYAMWINLFQDYIEQVYNLSCVQNLGHKDNIIKMHW